MFRRTDWEYRDWHRRVWRPGVWNFSASDGPDVRAARQSFVGNFRWPSPRMQANRSGDDQFSAHDRRDQGSSRYGIDNGRQGTANLENWCGGGLYSRSSARSEEHTSELQSPYVISYAVFCLKKKR